MKRLGAFLLALAPSILTSSALAGDADFLASFAGNWSGKGKVRVTAGSSPVTVSCAFDANTSPTTLSLDGKCRGMVVVSRRIGVTLTATEAGFSGSYIGSTTGPAGLSGVRSGSAFELSIRWARAVNGDQVAKMRVEMTETGAMRLTTVDADPKTGKHIVTSEITLSRG